MTAECRRGTCWLLSKFPHDEQFLINHHPTRNFKIIVSSHLPHSERHSVHTAAKLKSAFLTSELCWEHFFIDRFWILVAIPGAKLRKKQQPRSSTGATLQGALIVETSVAQMPVFEPGLWQLVTCGTEDRKDGMAVGSWEGHQSGLWGMLCSKLCDRAL